MGIPHKLKKVFLLMCILPVGCNRPEQRSFAGLFKKSPSSAETQADSIPQSDVNVLAAKRDEDAREASPRQNRLAPAMTYLSTNFDIMRVKVPTGMATESETIWNLVDEQVISAQTIQHLRKNGFRIGLTSQDDWAAIKVTLDEAERVVVNRLQFSPKNAGPMRIELDEAPANNTIFFYRPDQTLAGSAWPNSRKLINLHHRVDPEDLHSVFLGIEPEVRQQQTATRWEKTPLGMRQVRIHAGKVYADLAVTLPVPPQSVLVIGPSPAARHTTLIGQAFLTDTDDKGQTSEVILFFAPTVVRTTTAQLR